MEKDKISDMIFDLNDVIKTLKHHSIKSVVDATEKEGKTLFDLPKDDEGTPFSIGDLLETVRNHVGELFDEKEMKNE